MFLLRVLLGAESGTRQDPDTAASSTALAALQQEDSAASMVSSSTAPQQTSLLGQQASPPGTELTSKPAASVASDAQQHESCTNVIQGPCATQASAPPSTQVTMAPGEVSHGTSVEALHGRTANSSAHAASSEHEQQQQSPSADSTQAAAAAAPEHCSNTQQDVPTGTAPDDARGSFAGFQQAGSVCEQCSPTLSTRTQRSRSYEGLEMEASDMVVQGSPVRWPVHARPVPDEVAAAGQAASDAAGVASAEQALLHESACAASQEDRAAWQPVNPASGVAPAAVSAVHELKRSQACSSHDNAALGTPLDENQGELSGDQHCCTGSSQQAAVASPDHSNVEASGKTPHHSQSDGPSTAFSGSSNLQAFLSQLQTKYNLQASATSNVRQVCSIACGLQPLREDVSKLIYVPCGLVALWLSELFIERHLTTLPCFKLSYTGCH